MEKKPESPKDPLDELEVLKVPRIRFKSDSISRVKSNSPVDFDILNLKDFEPVPDPEIKTKTIFGTQIINPLELIRQSHIDPLLKKELYWIDAVQLQHRGDYFLSIIKYLHALDNAKKVGNQEEIEVINTQIKRILVDLPTNQQIKFLKYRQRMKI